MKLNSAVEKDLDLLLTGGPSLLINLNCHDQTRHNDFELREAWNPSLAMFFFGSGLICLSVCPASHTNVNYQISVKKLYTMLYLEAAPILAYFVFVGYEIFEHGECDWWGSYDLRYYNYLNFSTHNLGKVVAIAIGTRFHAVKKPAQGLWKKGPIRI